MHRYTFTAQLSLANVEQHLLTSARSITTKRGKPLTANNIMSQWLAEATRFEKELLATYAETSVATLQQIAGGYKTEGKARTGPGLALRLEAASKLVNKQFAHLPVLPAGELCERLKSIQSISE